MLPIAGQTAGPNGLTFFVDTHEWRGVSLAKKNRNSKKYFTGNAGPFRQYKIFFFKYSSAGPDLGQIQDPYPFNKGHFKKKDNIWIQFTQDGSRITTQMTDQKCGTFKHRMDLGSGFLLNQRPNLKNYDWFYLKLYSIFQVQSRRFIETGFWQI